MAGCCRNSGPPATIAGLIEAGTNVTVTGSGTTADPYFINAQTPARGAPVAMSLIAPATSVGGITVTRNPDGSATLNGMFEVPGPLVAGDPIEFAALPAGYAPALAAGIRTVAVAMLSASPVAVRIDINSGAGQMFVMPPTVAGGDTLEVSIDELTFWPEP